MVPPRDNLNLIGERLCLVFRHLVLGQDGQRPVGERAGTALFVVSVRSTAGVMRLPLPFRSYVAALSRGPYAPSRRSGTLKQRLLDIGDLTILESNFQALIHVNHFCARL
jgi:hypothetical protein